MEKSYNTYSEILVQRVNELYHDFVNKEYHYSHPEIFDQERERWERIGKQFLDFINPITVIDIGTGTGFVPLTISGLLKKGDVFICSDISKGILDVAEKNIKNQNFRCNFKFIKIESRVPFKLPFKTNSADVITINSVLHHIQDTNRFLTEVDRILKPEGLLFIGHEPNKYFNDHKFLWYSYMFINHFIHPKRTVYEILRKINLEKIIRKVYHFAYPKKKENELKYEELTHKINETLLKQKLIKKPILPREISELVDIKAQEGFKPDLLITHYKLLYLETYNHLYWVTIEHYNNLIIKKYDRMLRRKYPRHGASFFAVLKNKR